MARRAGSDSRGRAFSCHHLGEASPRFGDASVYPATAASAVLLEVNEHSSHVSITASASEKKVEWDQSTVKVV